MGFLIDTKIKADIKRTVMWCQIFDRRSKAPSSGDFGGNRRHGRPVDRSGIDFLFVRLGGSTTYNLANFLFFSLIFFFKHRGDLRLIGKSCVKKPPKLAPFLKVPNLSSVWALSPDTLNQIKI